MRCFGPPAAQWLARRRAHRDELQTYVLVGLSVGSVRNVSSVSDVCDHPSLEWVRRLRQRPAEEAGLQAGCCYGSGVRGTTTASMRPSAFVAAKLTSSTLSLSSRRK